MITNDSINNSVANKLGETVVTTSISRNTGGFFDSSLSDNELFTESPKKVEKYSNFIGIIQPSNIEIPPKEEQQISTSTRKITRLFGDGDEISFSDKKMGNIKESLSRVENNIIDKISTKLFSDSDEEFLSNFTLDKTQEKSTSEHDISNTKKNPNVFSESDDEIFTTGKVVKVNEKLGETMRDQNVKKLTHISGETDEGLASPILVETVEKNTKDETQFSVENKKTTKVFSETDEELFPSVSRKITKKKTTQLFGSDDDSEDDLFKNSSRKVVGGKSGGPASNTFLKKPLDHPQKSLFGDSSSDDDLFSGSGKSGKQGEFQFVLCIIFMLFVYTFPIHLYIIILLFSFKQVCYLLRFTHLHFHDFSPYLKFSAVYSSHDFLLFSLVSLLFLFLISVYFLLYFFCVIFLYSFLLYFCHIISVFLFVS